MRAGVVIGIVVLALCLRLVRLGADSLWYDETVSVTLAAKSLPELVAHTAGDIHPPGYYVLLHGWLRLAGRSEFAAALPSLFFGVLLVALAYRLGRRVFGPAAGRLAALLVAISPFNVWYSQEVRMYTLGAALGVGALLAMLELLDALPGRARWAALAAYGVCAALGLWVLYYFAFLLLALNGMAAVWWLAAMRRAGRVDRSAGLGRRSAATASLHPATGRGPERKRLGRLALAWLGGQAAVLLAYAPWLPVAWRQAKNPPVPPWRSWTGLGDVLTETWTALSVGQSMAAAAAWPALLLSAILAAAALWARSTRRWPGYSAPAGRPSAGFPLFLAGFVLLPVLLIYLASLLTPLFHVRYAFTYSTPFYVLLAGGLVALGRRWRPAPWLALSILAVFCGLSLAAYHGDARFAADDHRAATSFLADHWRPGDAILVDAGYAYPALLTYWHGDPIAWRGRLVGDAWPAAGGPAVFQAGTVDGDPGLGWGNPASDFYSVSWADTAAALEQLWAEYDRVWVYRIYDTVTDPRGAIRDWLAANSTAFEDRVFTGESQLRVQGYVTRRDPLTGAGPAAAPHAVLAGGSLELLAVSVAGRQVAVGQALDAAAVWQVHAPLPETMGLYVGLVDATGRRWAQSDERPLGSLYPASSWPAGAQVRTPLRVAVPPGVLPGRYTLEMGWYRIVDGQTAPLPFEGGERLALAEVGVTAPADWRSLPLPAMQHRAGVTIGPNRLLGLNAPRLQARAGDGVGVELFWQGTGEAGPGAAAALLLMDDGGQVFAEAPAGGEALLAPGQVLRDTPSLRLPGGLPPGAYTLAVALTSPAGQRLPVRRGLVPLGDVYPLATVFVEGRPLTLTPPDVEQPLEARLGAYVRFVGHDLSPRQPTCAAGAEACELAVTLHWQVLAPAPAPFKIFCHLIAGDDPTAIAAQADVYPAPATTAWVAGEYLAQTVTLKMAAAPARGRYTLLCGFYDEAGGARLPVLDAAGQPAGDSLVLRELTLGQ